MVAAAQAAPNGNPVNKNLINRSLGLPQTLLLYRHTSFLEKNIETFDIICCFLEMLAYFKL